MAITKFGKSVRLEIADSSGSLIFDTSGLRVDFEVRIISGYNRAKFTIFNLSAKTIKEISNGERFVKLFVRLHDREEQELQYSFYINNAVTVKQVPNSLTELYCIGTLRRNFTSKTVNIKITNPTLDRYCNALAKGAGQTIHFKFVDFPDEIRYHKPIKPTAVWSGEVLKALEKLGRAYSFSVNEEPGNVIKLIYLPLASNQKQSGQNTRKTYKLKTVNMRSNPRIGIAHINIESNLDFNIKAGTLLDTSELLTAAVGEDFEFLTQINNQIVSPTAGYSRYSTLEVTHIGSNYTNSWSTTAMAVKPTSGTKTLTCD